MAEFENGKQRSAVLFVVLMACAFTVVMLYLYNIVKWGAKPDYGFVFQSATGVNTVGGLTSPGRQADLKIGDTFLKVNGKRFSNIAEFRNAMKKNNGETNTYRLQRNGGQLEISITNMPLGVKKAFYRSGIPFLVGLCYILIGILVFLMKPHHRINWVFLIFCTNSGLLLLFLNKVSKLIPDWFGTVEMLFYMTVPASFALLALNFPENWNLGRKKILWQAVPYAFSIVLFGILRSVSSEMTGIPKVWFMVFLLYLLLMFFFFLSVCMYAWLRSPSEIASVRSKLILFGTGLSFLVPILDQVLNSFFQLFFFPNVLYYLPFFLIFPLAIAYSITKHNLFDINATIRLTFGYLILTAGITVIYFVVVVILSLFLGDIWQQQSHFLFLSILMIVIFTFGFLRKRVQTYVDRIFFRIGFDYRETVAQIGRAMRSLLNVEQVVMFMRDIAENVIFADRSYVMLLNREKRTYECAVESCPVMSLAAGEPLIQKIAQEKREITRYDIEENPLFALDREQCKETFGRLEAGLIVPLIYEESLSGFMALGKKKSGKAFKYEDVLLLKTLANQGAMAIEKARLFTDLEGQTEILLQTNLRLEQEVDQRKRAEAELNKYKRQLEEKVARQNIELDRSRKALADLKGDIKRGHRFGKIIGKNEAMRGIYALIKDLADVSSTVLITGESGTGKELVAEALHAESRHRDRPFVKVNCSALSESVLESELFGHVKGAFTGADRDKIGRFQKAADGSILLDEIGDVSLNFQKRLLRVLQEREFERLGDTTTLSMQARVMAATNQNLLEKVNRGEFRQDLYYRLKVVEVKLPSLRERKEDIPLLIHHFLNAFNRELEKKIHNVSPEVLRILMAYQWPGNVRELRNTLEHICILCKSETIVEGDLPSDFPGHEWSFQEPFQSRQKSVKPSSRRTVPDDKQALLDALEQAQWNKTRAAEILGISRRTLYRRLKAYRI